MKCLILAAGYATRLYPLTENFPKPLLKVGEKSILDWLVDDLVDTTDIDEFVVISNHKFAQHENTFVFQINFCFIFHHNFSYPPLLNPLLISLHDNKPVYRLQQQSIRRLAFVPPYSVFCSISFRCGGLSIERNQKPLAPKITLAATHHDRQKQVEVKRSSRVNPHEIRIFSGCPYAVVKQGTKKFTKK